MAVDGLIRSLQRNDPGRKYYHIILDNFENNNQVAQLAQALHGNDCAIEFHFECNPGIQNDWNTPLNWDPLLRELETRDKLESIYIRDTDFDGLVPLVRQQIFQALRRNANLRKLIVSDFKFSSNNSDGFVSFLDSSPGLTDLLLFRCRADDRASPQAVAAALQRNTRIQSLDLHAVQPSIFCPIFQSLAASGGLPCLKKLDYGPSLSSADNGTNAEALKLYLESPNATIQVFKFQDTQIDSSESSKILIGLGRCTSVNEIIFEGCELEDNEEEEEDLQELVDLVRKKPHLSTLRVLDEELFRCQRFSNAVAEVVISRTSPLRCLDIAVDSIADGPIPIEVLQNLMTAVSRSTRLEHLSIRCNDLRYFREEQIDHITTILDNIPSFKVNELTLRFDAAFDVQDDRLLETLKRNFVVQNVRVLDYRVDINWFNPANQARLDFFLNRNRKLAAWTENPFLVPCELWQYAMMLALEAGINSLYQSLLSLSGQDIGLKMQGRKRRRPRYFKPS